MWIAMAIEDQALSMSHHRLLVVQVLPGIGDMIWHLPHIRESARVAPSLSTSCIISSLMVVSPDEPGGQYLSGLRPATGTDLP
jgi:hypothetical protein